MMPSGCSGCMPAACCVQAFRPGREIAALREYLRLRERPVGYAASYIQHMQKALTFMNLQLHPVVSDIIGATGMRIIRAILGGERDPKVLAALRDGRCHSSIETIEAALVGNYPPEHLFVLKQPVALYDFYQKQITQCGPRDRVGPGTAVSRQGGAVRAPAQAALPEATNKPARLQCPAAAVSVVGADLMQFVPHRWG
uniref:Uncharacterized protein n=1 Tax=Aromatoleum buckelii TaxID=200254 RepID=A0ABX1N5W7_9RHOO